MTASTEPAGRVQRALSDQTAHLHMATPVGDILTRGDSLTRRRRRTLLGGVIVAGVATVSGFSVVASPGSSPLVPQAQAAWGPSMVNLPDSVLDEARRQCAPNVRAMGMTLPDRPVAADSKNGETLVVYRNDKVTLQEIEALNPANIVISPGPGHPLHDSGISIPCIKHFAGKIPILGVCMGLQSIYSAYTGIVEFAGEIVHGKTSEIAHDGKGLYAGLPAHGVVGTRYHSLAAQLPSLPKELVVTSKTASGVVMGTYQPAGELVTDRDRTGSGIGKILVDDAVEIARHRGVTQMRLDCYAADDALIGVYERFGFTLERRFTVDTGQTKAWPGAILRMEI